MSRQMVGCSRVGRRCAVNAETPVRGGSTPPPTTKTRDPYRLEFSLPGLPATTNSIGRKHWTVKAKEATKWKDAVVLAAISSGRPPAPLKRARLVLTRHSTSSPDPDGLVSSFKHIIDGLVVAGILENDRFVNIGMPEYRWEPCKRGKGMVSVIVIEVAGV